MLISVKIKAQRSILNYFSEKPVKKAKMLYESSTDR